MASSAAHRRRPAMAVVVGTTVALAILFASSAAAGATAKGFKRGSTVTVVEETVTAIQKSGGPKKPSSRRADAASSSEPAPVRPVKVEQSIADAMSLAGNATGTTGRKLLALGDRCTVTLKNACKSKRTFQANFGYFTWNGVGGQSGWVSEGTWSIKHRKSLRFVGQQTLFFWTSTGLRPTRTATKPATFCVTHSPFTIFLGDNDDTYYSIDDSTNTYTDSYYCFGVGGWLRGGFYSPVYCGLTFTFSAC